MLAIYSKLLLVLFFYTTAHPLHVSTTELSFNQKDKSIEVSCKIFTDDFERVLSNTYKAKTDLSKPELHKAMDILIKKYMDANLHFVVNGKNVRANYIGFEIDSEATNVYLEIEDIPSLQSLNLTNTILYDLFDDQMNILHVERKGDRKSARANYPSNRMSVVF
ncbi:MAG: DUF6702 family protein [Bacteroidia bacterium]